MGNHHLEPLSQLYLSEKDIAQTTRKLYRIVFKQYISYLIETQIEYASTSNIIDYRERMRNIGYSTHWIYIQINVIKGFYRYLRVNHKRLCLDNVYSYDVTESIKNEKIKSHITKSILTIEQAKHLILFTKNNRKSIWHYRDHAILYLMITTGMRSIEIRRAKRKDYHIQNGQMILYIQGKGRTAADEYVKITKGVEKAIKEYLDRRKDNNPYLFISHSKHSHIPYLSRTFFIEMFNRVLKDSGLEDTKITPHSLRHTAATLNLLRGGSLEATRQLLRHTKLDTTLIYAHHIERMKNDSENQIEKYILGEESYINNYNTILINL